MPDQPTTPTKEQELPNEKSEIETEILLSDKKTFSADELEAGSIRYGNRGIWLLPLRSGNLALFDRGFNLISIIDDLPTAAEISLLAQESEARCRADMRAYELSHFLGEPSDRQLVRDIRRAERTPVPRSPKQSPLSQAIDIDL